MVAAAKTSHEASLSLHLPNMVESTSVAVGVIMLDSLLVSKRPEETVSYLDFYSLYCLR